MSSVEQLELETHSGPSEQLQKLLQQLAAEMLENAREHGVGFDEVRMAAETRGWLTGEESGRWLSFGSVAMKKAGGVPLRRRPSRHPKSTRRSIVVFVHPRYLHLDANYRPVPPSPAIGVGGEFGADRGAASR